MNRVLLGVGFAVVACGGDSPVEPTAETGTIFFRTEPVTCSYTASVTFFIENEDVGTETLAPGALSLGYETKATAEYSKVGKPVVQARVVRIGETLALWTYRENVILEAGQSVTHTFSC